MVINCKKLYQNIKKKKVKLRNQGLKFHSLGRYMKKKWKI